jgi:hypothetical protein
MAHAFKPRHRCVLMTENSASPHVREPARPVATAFGRRNERLHKRPLFVRQTARIAQSAPVIASSILARPHWRPPQSNQVAFLESQMIPTIQYVPGQTLKDNVLRSMAHLGLAAMSGVVNAKRAASTDASKRSGTPPWYSARAALQIRRSCQAPAIRYQTGLRLVQ